MFIQSYGVSMISGTVCNILQHTYTYNSEACMALLYFSTLSHKVHSFRGRGVLNIKCVEFLPATPLILQRIQQDTANLHRSSGEVPIIIVIF